MCALTLSVWCRSSIRAGTVYMRRDLNMALQQCVVFSGKASCASAITSRPRLRVCARACERGRKKRKEEGGVSWGLEEILVCWNAFTPGETRDFGIDEGRREREREMHVAWGERVSGLLWVHWLSKKSLNGVFDVFVNANITVIGREGTWVFF